MRKAQRRMLLLGLIPVLAVVGGGAAVTVSVIRGRLDYTYSTVHAQPADGVSITANVELHVSPSPDDQVHIALSGTYTDREPTIDVRNVDTPARELQIAARCEGSGCRVALDVELPGTKGLRVNSTDASVELVRLIGDLDVTADGGSVDGAKLISQHVTVNGRSGSVDLGFAQPPSSVDATTTNGSLHVLVPAIGAYAIDASAVHGSTELNVNNDLGSTRELHLHSTNGSIIVDSN